jgi:hypothetical protein
MQPDLQPVDPLSKVVFVHDYLQLVFQDCAFTIYNLATYTKATTVLRQGEPGFCDALVSLINQTAHAEARAESLLLRFTSGVVVSVPISGPDTRGPEAWQFARLGGPHIVEQNA